MNVEEIRNLHNNHLNKVETFPLTRGGVGDLNCEDLYEITHKDDIHKLNVYKEGMKIADVGCWLGLSTIMMATNVKEANGKVYAIDWFKGWKYKSEEINLPKGNEPYCAYYYNIPNILYEIIKILGLENNVKIMKMTSIEASKRFEDNYFDMVFIDANHGYKSIKEDIEVWYPKVKQGGVISGHDFAGLVPLNHLYAMGTDKIVGNEPLHYKDFPEYSGYHIGVILAVELKFGDEIQVFNNSIWLVKKR